MQQGVTERQRGPGQACSAGRAQVSADANYVVVTSSRRPIRANQSPLRQNAVTVPQTDDDRNLTGFGNVRGLSPHSGVTARGGLRGDGVLGKMDVVRHADVRHHVRPDDEGLAPPAGASGKAFGFELAWLARPTFDDEQEEVIVLPMVAGRFRRAQGGLDGSDQAK